MSLMNVGVTALNANQAALQTIGHNIANVNTAGYSRQTLALQTVAGQNRGSGYIGNGVSVATVMRNYSELLNKQATAAQAASAADVARSDSLNQMQDIFSGGDAGLGAAINNMMNSFADLGAAPMDSTARNVVLTRIAELTARFRAASTSLEEQDYATKQQITNDVTVVNSLASQVATLNIQISRALATGHTPNDLLDKRDQLIRDINQYVKTSQVAADDGSINLYVGGSQALVLGSTVGQLSVSESKDYPGSGKLSLYFSQLNGGQVELSASMVAGGEIAGLLKFNNEDLVEGRNLLGRLTLAIGTELNKQQELGLTLSGHPGTALFGLPTSMPGYSNIPGYNLGTPSASVTYANTRALVASDYKIVFGATAADTKIVRLSDGKTHALVGDLGVADPLPAPTEFEVDGLKFSLDANAITGTQGQSILFQPFSAAAGSIKALVHTPEDLAVSNSISAAISTANQGTLQLSKLQAVSTLPPVYPVEIAFETIAGITHYSYSLDNGVTTTRLEYPANGVIRIQSQNITFTTPPSDGSTATVNRTTASVSDPAVTVTAQPVNLVPALGTPVTITFDVDATTGAITYNYNGNTAGPLPYKSGEAIAIDGWEIKLAGTPKDGDTVEVSNAKEPALGDSYKRNSGNAAAFMDLRDTAIFDHSTTLADGFSATMAIVGTRTQSAQYAAELSTSVATSLEGERTAVSGVNLDEEAARLLQFQQSYQASAKVIQIAQSLFDSVLNAVNN